MSVDKLEDRVYSSEDARLKFLDLSKKGGLAQLTRNEAKTSNSAQQQFLKVILSIAKRLNVLTDVSPLRFIISSIQSGDSLDRDKVQERM